MLNVPGHFSYLLFVDVGDEIEDIIWMLCFIAVTSKLITNLAVSIGLDSPSIPSRSACQAKWWAQKSIISFSTSQKKKNKTQKIAGSCTNCIIVVCIGCKLKTWLVVEWHNRSFWFWLWKWLFGCLVLIRSVLQQKICWGSQSETNFFFCFLAC